MSDSVEYKRPLGLALLLIIGGAIGLYSAFALTLDKFEILTNPQADLDCNFSVIVQCGKNLLSDEGSAFGFPNPIIGLVGFTAAISVGTSLLAGARFARWFWLLFNAGMLFAIGFVIWLLTHSIYELGTLCPWCMVVWSVTIPMFWAVTLYNAKTGVIPTGAARPFLSAAYGWVPAISVACYLTIAIMAQVRLDLLSFII